MIPKNFSDDRPASKTAGPARLIFILSICVLTFVCYASLVDVYYFVVVGAVYEFLWLPMIIMIFTLPVLAFIFWRKDKFRFRWFYPATLLICMLTLLVLFY